VTTYLVARGHIRRLAPAAPLGALVGLATLVLARTHSDAQTDRVIASVLIAIALAPALVDSAACVVDPSPTTRRARTGHRIAWLGPIALLGWLGVQAAWIPGHALVPPLWAWALLVSVASLVLAIESALARYRTTSGIVAPPLVVGAIFAAQRLPARVAVHPVPEHPMRWTLVAAVGLGALWWSTRDLARVTLGAERIGRRRRPVRRGDQTSTARCFAEGRGET
jgi:hypothetical protein